MKISAETRATGQRRSLVNKGSKAAQQSFLAPSSSRPGSWVPLHINQTTKTQSDPHDLWRTGPADPSGVVLDLSDRPLLCMSVRGTEAAIGCADHGVYVVDVVSQKLQRNLFAKKYGHSEWVTSVDYLRDGRIISGGMDNVLCLWDAVGVRCKVLTGHSASISVVKVIDSSYAISSSYDKTLMLWDLNRGTQAGCLQGHRGAVVNFTVNSKGAIVSGSREGEVFLWDGRDGKAVMRCKAAHQGQVTALESFTEDQSEIFLTGGQDGRLRVWDTRLNKAVSTITLSGSGAVSNIAITSPLVIAATTDKIIRVLEPRSSFQMVRSWADHTDVICSMHACGSMLWSGGGNGRLLVHDVTTGSCLYGLGATSRGATRCVSLLGPQLLAAVGDDGNCIIYRV